MKNIYGLFFALILTGAISSCASHPSQVRTEGEVRKLYAVLFKIFIDETGELKICNVHEVIDTVTHKEDPNFNVPTEYRESVTKIVKREKHPPKIENGKPVEFFFIFFIDPIEPNKVYDYDDKNKIFILR